MSHLPAAPAHLPPLRQDLALHAGPAASDGTPTWTLHDPAANRFYQLSWPAFELLSRWSLRHADALLQAVQRETTLRIGAADLEALLRMLSQCNLCAAGARDTPRLVAQARGAQAGLGGWLLKNYLFFRIPLLRPAALLDRVAPYVRWAFQPLFWAGVAVIAVLGLALAAQRWDVFSHTAIGYASWSGALAIGLALSAAKVLHELGHALAAQRAGCRVPAMGVAVMVLWPVLYTDTNEAWKLTSRRQRLVIGAAGMLVELALAALATLVWSLLPEAPAWQPVKSGAFLLATSTWVLTLTVNASPFMRFDGYFLLSDALNLPNLHERAFAMGRWWLRECLFGWGDAPPESQPLPRRRFMVGFAWVTWVYRLVLFLGIAWLVYEVFFKALGVLLMAVELGWFIARPVARELQAWWQRRRALRWNHATSRSAVVLGGAVLLLVWPWHEQVRAPAVLGARQVLTVYTPAAAQAVTALPAAGQGMRAGETLLQLQSPDLASRLDLARARERQLQWQLQQQPFDEQLVRLGPALRRHWEGAAAEVAGLAGELERLQLRAPFDGTVVDTALDVMPNSWIGTGERLLRVVGTGGAKVDAFVDEATLQGLAEVQRAVFIPDAFERPRVFCKAVQADAVQLAQLDHAALASPYGGAIAAQRNADGTLVPRQPTFKVRLEQCEPDAVPRQEVAGVVRLEGPRRSWLERGLRALTRAGWARLAR